ncbi:divalent-cation tolerance protein CutA [Streptomyces mirabilis]|uniref:divalent-cation tolerance protein CutA n=1 Tax=Streptomyces mirabilis TaxID=68239 RepID=UPI001BAEC9F5|nr:divalent-cation tolerance protein CutA [Streptomyces mirabilis]QUW85127.1 divalent-cation tolerance protein CutA [Streptomyces mirabilis]
MAAGAGTGTAAGTAAWLTVLTTTDAPEKAEALARGAVEARAAACAQITGPVTSVYRWKGAVETASEWQVLFKTTGARYDALEAYLLAAHDYDTPEIIATPVVRGSADYLRWVEEETVAEESMEAESVTEETVAEETAE